MTLVIQPLSWLVTLDYEWDSLALLQLSERGKNQRCERQKKQKYSGLHEAPTYLQEIVLYPGSVSLCSVEKEACHNLSSVSLGTGDSKYLAILWSVQSHLQQRVNKYNHDNGNNICIVTQPFQMHYLICWARCIITTMQFVLMVPINHIFVNAQSVALCGPTFQSGRPELTNSSLVTD